MTVLEARALQVEQHRLHLERRLTPAPTMGDARLLERALGNLVDNAIKYTQDEGHLRIETASEVSEAVFRVVDDGSGIQVAELQSIFEPFYRPDVARTRKTGGMGLGLAIVRAVAESHGGKALLLPVPAGETCAELRLPLG